MTRFIIDPPNPFATAAEWGAHIDRLRALIRENPDAPELRAALKSALAEKPESV